jgi:hypothetical protein
MIAQFFDLVSLMRCPDLAVFAPHLKLAVGGGTLVGLVFRRWVADRCRNWKRFACWFGISRSVLVENAIRAPVIRRGIIQTSTLWLIPNQQANRLWINEMHTHVFHVLLQYN